MLERVYVASRTDRPEALEALRRVVDLLNLHKSQVLLSIEVADLIERREIGVTLDELRRNPPTLIIVVGGDGTLLRLHRQIGKLFKRVLPVRVGTHGFLSEITPKYLPEALKRIGEGDYLIEKREKIEISLRGLTHEAINEAAVLPETGKAARLIVRLNEWDVLAGVMDGCVVSTPTGSLAYNLSAGGPAVHPAVEALIVTLLNPWPFSLSVPLRSIVVPPNTIITIKNIGKKPAFVAADGMILNTLNPAEETRVKRAGRYVEFVRFKEDFFYRRLKAWRTKTTKQDV